METVLELKSSSHRALIPLLKRLGFIDAANVPTDAYRNYRDPDQSALVMAEKIRTAYSDLYKANEYAHNLKKDDLQSKLRAVLGAADDDEIIPSVVGTFTELVKLADFKGVPSAAKVSGPSPQTPAATVEAHRPNVVGALGLSYTINLNLPASTDIEVFNAIFKSLKENILNG